MSNGASIENSSLSTEKKMELVFKVLTVLIIPVLLWVNSLSVTIAVMEEKIKTQTSDIKEMKAKVENVNYNSKSLEDIKKDLKETNKNINDLIKLIPN
jgi:Tfp pilus assembly protein PilO